MQFVYAENADYDSYERNLRPFRKLPLPKYISVLSTCQIGLSTASLLNFQHNPPLLSFPSVKPSRVVRDDRLLPFDIWRPEGCHPDRPPIERTAGLHCKPLHD
jgi:hypothetical protein